jgi:hypothetical protein
MNELTCQSIATVAQRTLSNTAGLEDSLDTDFKLVNIVEGIEYTEDVDTVLLGLLTEVDNGVVGQRRVCNTIGATEQHLEGNVWHSLPHLLQSLPRVLVEKAHSDIKSGTAPAFKGPGIAQGMAGLSSNVEHFDSSDSGCQKGLMGISPGCVHNEATLVLANSLGKCFRALFNDDVPPASFARHGCIDYLALVVNDLRDDDVPFEFRLSNLSLDLATVDSEVSEVGEQLLSTVGAANEREKLRSNRRQLWKYYYLEIHSRVVNERRPASSLNKCRMGKEGSEERNVGLHTTDTEFNQRTKHLPTDYLVCRSVAAAFDKHAIIVCSRRVSKGYTEV